MGKTNVASEVKGIRHVMLTRTLQKPNMCPSQPTTCMFDIFVHCMHKPRNVSQPCTVMLYKRGMLQLTCCGGECCQKIAVSYGVAAVSAVIHQQRPKNLANSAGQLIAIMG